MWFKIDLNGIKFSIRIKGYHRSTNQWDEEWCKVDLTLLSDNWLNYSIENDELLLMFEVEELLQRRAGGNASYTTKRKEADKPVIVSGIVDGVTDGNPIEAEFINANQRTV